MLTWQFASPEEYIPVCELFRSSEISKGNLSDIERRITTPLILGQLITFYRGSKLWGFVTFAFMSDESEQHMATTGILPSDWRSGKKFWAIDYVAKSDGYKMLRIITKALGVKTCRYFRHKHKEIREVRA